MFSNHFWNVFLIFFPLSHICLNANTFLTTVQFVSPKKRKKEKKEIFWSFLSSQHLIVASNHFCLDYFSVCCWFVILLGLLLLFGFRVEGDSGWGVGWYNSFDCSPPLSFLLPKHERILQQIGCSSSRLKRREILGCFVFSTSHCHPACLFQHWGYVFESVPMLLDSLGIGHPVSQHECVVCFCFRGLCCCCFCFFLGGGGIFVVVFSI